MALKAKLLLILLVGSVCVTGRSIKRQRKLKSSKLAQLLPALTNCCPVSLIDLPCSPVIEPCSSQNIILDAFPIENNYAAAIKLPKCNACKDVGIPVPAINVPAVFNVIDLPSCQCQSGCQCQSIPICQCQNLPCQNAAVCQCQNVPCQSQMIVDTYGCSPMVDILNPYDITGSLLQISCLESALSPYLVETSLCQPAVVKLPVDLPCGCQNKCGCQLTVPEVAYQYIDYSCGCQKTPCSCQALPCSCQSSPCSCQSLPCSCQSSPCSCQSSPCSCQSLPCSCQSSPCSCQTLPCTCQSLPCSCQSLPCSCQSSPCSCQTLPCSCQTLPCSCQSLPCSCQSLPCSCQTLPCNPCGCSMSDCGCQSACCECGCGKYLRQVVLQPPFL